MDYIEEAKKVFDLEIEALQQVRNNLDNHFLQILEAISRCVGKVVVTGMGKSGHVARKIASTMASLGTPAFFLHPAEALHGDLGMIGENDVVIAISYSGESEEITRLLSNIKAIGATLIGISGNAESTLMRHSDVSQVLPSFQEACYFNLAPTSSTTATLVYGDALAVVATRLHGFTENNFGLYHPAGSLGKKILIKVEDVMAAGEYNAVINTGATLTAAIVELGKKGLGIVSVTDNNDKILGVITDGDLRRQLEKGVDVYGLRVDEIMTRTPLTIGQRNLAVEALQRLKEKNVSSAPVVDACQKVVGTVRLRDILNRGIVL